MTYLRRVMIVNIYKYWSWLFLFVKWFDYVSIEVILYMCYILPISFIFANSAKTSKLLVISLPCNLKTWSGILAWSACSSSSHRKHGPSLGTALRSLPDSFVPTLLTKITFGYFPSIIDQNNYCHHRPIAVCCCTPHYKHNKLNSDHNHGCCHTDLHNYNCNSNFL